jgi:predicted RNase H-like nuclease (RuvC/YqgF family)
MEPAIVTFENDFRSVNDINTAYEEICRENRQLKRINYELYQKIKNLEEQLSVYKFPGDTNLIDLI